MQVINQVVIIWNDRNYIDIYKLVKINSVREPGFGKTDLNQNITSKRSKKVLFQNYYSIIHNTFEKKIWNKYLILVHYPNMPKTHWRTIKIMEVKNRNTFFRKLFFFEKLSLTADKSYFQKRQFRENHCSRVINTYSYIHI